MELFFMKLTTQMWKNEKKDSEREQDNFSETF